MYKESRTNLKEENLKEAKNVEDRSPKISNQGVLIECNLLDNNSYNLGIR